MCCVWVLLLLQGLVLQDDLKARMRVLRRLGYIDTGGADTQTVSSLLEL
jgi:hypothetical protein